MCVMKPKQRTWKCHWGRGVTIACVAIEQVLRLRLEHDAHQKLCSDPPRSFKYSIEICVILETTKWFATKPRVVAVVEDVTDNFKDSHNIRPEILWWIKHLWLQIEARGSNHKSTTHFHDRWLFAFYWPDLRRRYEVLCHSSLSMMVTRSLFPRVADTSGLGDFSTTVMWWGSYF